MGGELYGFAVGNQPDVSLNGLNGSGSITISVIFYVNGEKTYPNITVGDSHQSFQFQKVHGL
ncbi:hypothetical protein [Celerinatantimonas sp. YJH-8]|uniref:hypothetical protein n=1 Tax=Celerinatantimonas sp. YJH-8 TaxID=3228714 RepID=UPI0038C5E9EF